MDLTNDQRIAAIERECDRIIDLATPSNLDRPVPSCPDWTYLDLVKHLARVYSWAGSIVEGQLGEPPSREELARRPDNVSHVDWLADRLDFVTRALRTTPETASVWNFGQDSPGNPAWWARRQMNETIIHRVDAESAADHERSTAGAGATSTPVDPQVAADIVDEVLELLRFEEVEPDDMHQADGIWVHLHATDASGAEWTVDTASKTFTRAHMKGDVALRGPAWALARWTWGRLPEQGSTDKSGTPSELEVFGDVAAAETWRRTLPL